jgi:hypothetical protein
VAEDLRTNNVIRAHFVEPTRQSQSKPPLLLVPTVTPPSMADAQSLFQHFAFLMLPGDLPMFLQSENFTQLLELGNLTTLQQTRGK